MSTYSKKHNFDEVFDSQALFRLILKAISNPMQKVTIKEFTDKMKMDNSDFLAVALTLLDNEVSFNTCENRQLSDEIISLTLSSRETLEQADYIFVDNSDDMQRSIENAKCGTLINPHKSATIIVKIPNGEKAITLKGPGIDGNITLTTSSLVDIALQIRDNRFFEYPEGIDFIFIDEDYNLFCIPRLAKKEVMT